MPPDPIDAQLAHFAAVQQWLRTEVQSLERTRAYLPDEFVQRRARELQARYTSARREFDRWLAAHT